MSTIWIWWGISWNIPVVWFIIVTYPSFDLVFCFKSSLKPWCGITRHLINFKGVEWSSIALNWTLWQILTRCFFKKFFLTSTSLGTSVIWLTVYEIYSLQRKVCLSIYVFSSYPGSVYSLCLLLEAEPQVAEHWVQSSHSVV